MFRPSQTSLRNRTNLAYLGLGVVCGILSLLMAQFLAQDLQAAYPVEVDNFLATYVFDVGPLRLASALLSAPAGGAILGYSCATQNRSGLAISVFLVALGSINMATYTLLS